MAGVLYLCLGIAQIVALCYLIDIHLERAGFCGICPVVGFALLFFGAVVSLMRGRRTE